MNWKKRSAAERLGTPTGTSGTFLRVAWSEADWAAVQRHAEELWRERTPPAEGADPDPRSRVTADELESWASMNLGRRPPAGPAWRAAVDGWIGEVIARNPVHIQWLQYTLCRASGAGLPPITSPREADVTCEACRAILEAGSQPLD